MAFTCLLACQKTPPAPAASNTAVSNDSDKPPVSARAIHCDGLICAPHEMCCIFHGSRSCVPVPSSFPESERDLAKRADAMLAACGVDRFDFPPHTASLCGASGDCDSGEYCAVRLVGEELQLGQCSKELGPGSSELSSEGEPCHEEGSLCRERTCVREDAVRQCGRTVCGAAEVCCRDQEDWSFAIRCRAREKCQKSFTGEAVPLPCTSSAQCAEGRRCVVNIEGRSRCEPVGAFKPENEAILCELSDECDLLKCEAGKTFSCVARDDGGASSCNCAAESDLVSKCQPDARATPCPLEDGSSGVCREGSCIELAMCQDECAAIIGKKEPCEEVVTACDDPGCDGVTGDSREYCEAVRALALDDCEQGRGLGLSNCREARAVERALCIADRCDPSYPIPGDD